MINLPKIIEGIEELVYNILMWILFVPKTLAKILFHPTWVVGYVTEQLTGDVKNKFDDYVSPVILIFLSTLIPFAYAYATPSPSVTLSGPAEVQVNKDAEFSATANFISKVGQFTYEWGDWDGNDYYADGTWNSNQPMDYLIYNWDTPGWKTVTITASNDKGESYYNESDIYVVDPNQPLSEQDTSSGAASPKGGGMSKNWRSVLEGTPGGLAALGFLSIPLLFALAMEAFRGNPLSGSSLMRSFYIQCYVFSPFALASWSLILGVKLFLTPSQWLLTGLAGLVVLVLLVWLFRNQVLLVAAERRLRRGTAFWIVLGCMLGIAVIASLAFLLWSDAEAFRQFLGLFYIVFVAGLFLTGVWRRIFKKRPRKDAGATK